MTTLFEQQGVHVQAEQKPAHHSGLAVQVYHESQGRGILESVKLFL